VLLARLRHTDERQVGGYNASHALLRDALVGFFSSEWFRRVWTVQEFVLSKKSIFHCGPLELDGQAVIDSFQTLRRHAFSGCCSDDIAIHEKSLRYGTSIFDAMTRFSVMYILKSAWPERGTFPGVLHRYRMQRCSDPRDRIYGALGIPGKDPIMSNIIPDYTISVKNLYIKVAKEQIGQSQTLDILTYVVSGQNSTLDLPSYVPDWSVPLESEVFRQYLDREWITSMYDAAGSTPADFHLVSDSEATAKGIFIDDITILGKLHSRVFPDELRQTRDIAMEACEIANLPKQPPTSLEDASPADIALFKTLCGNIARYQYSDGSLRPRVVDLAHDYEAYLQWWKQAAEVSADGLTSPSSFGSGNSFYSAFSMHIAGRRFMRTVKGYLGVVPADSRPGDQMVVLAGGKVPHVIRQRDHEAKGFQEPVYEYIGYAYLYGFMNEEALSGDPEWRTFHLR
jgi:hypothetical protein